MASETELFILYQMGNSEDWTWFSPIGVFLSENALREYASTIGVSAVLSMLLPDGANRVRLMEPQEYVIVKSREGAVPEVELAG